MFLFLVHFHTWTALILALGELDSHILYDYAHAPKEEMFKFMHVT